MRSAVLVVFLTAALTGCPGTGSTKQVEPPTKQIAGHGVAISVPASWDGRVEWPDPGYARILHVASFPLPEALDARGHGAERLLEGDEVYINMGLDPALSSPARLQVGRADLVDEWEGKVAEAAFRAGPLTGGEGLLQVWITFGSRPTDAQLAQVNAVLARLDVSSE